VSSNHVVAPVITGLAVGITTIILFSFAFMKDGRSQSQSFTIGVADQQFTLRATDTETIQQLIDNHNGKNNFHVTGTLVKGDGRFNSPWSWQLDPSSVRMAEVSIELCDGTQSSVEENLDYWLDTVQTYCPWSSKVVSIKK
jgi:hypothetical protein